jgi:hypothetical protein
VKCCRRLSWKALTWEQFTDPGSVPQAWHTEVSTVSNPPYKKCRHTQLYRPLRSHYCNITRRPVLNLDHFCPWVANAVGFRNRKFFILFCFYGMLTCAFAAVSLGPSAFSARQDTSSNGDATNRALALMAFIMDATFSIALSLFTFGHCYMAAKNTTSLEDSSESKRYDLGWKENLKTVFGQDPRFWLLPWHKSQLLGDGVHWKLQDGSWIGFPTSEGTNDKV